jgi:pyridoxamine 5'-phosphate oxidase
MNETLENLRVSYRQNSLDTKDCDKNPRQQFDKWFEDAVKSKCDEPNAFVLSTVIKNRPRGRVVLLKGIHQEKFVFYTNYQSAKGQEIEACTYVSMTFLWLPLQRQVRIEGKIQKVDAILSDDYFQKRPIGNQIGAIASPQSKKVESRAELERLFREAEEKFKLNTCLTRPENWGGYAILPDYFEFWQGRDSRMHDRIIYEKSEDGWNLGRLAP